MTLAVTLSVEELSALVRKAVREELQPAQAAAPEVLTREQAAKMLSLHPNVLTRWVQKRGVPGVKIGGEWRFLRTDLIAWIAAQKKGA
jgi:excisionase family DNA binding protein